MPGALASATKPSSPNTTTTEVAVVDLTPAGPLDRFVDGTRGPGELHFRVGCTSGDGDFVASGELMQIVYDLP
jgi:hypothetical protein